MIFYIVSMWPNSIIYDKKFVINQFLDNLPFYTPLPLKIQENHQRFSGVFKVCKMETLTTNVLIEHLRKVLSWEYVKVSLTFLLRICQSFFKVLAFFNFPNSQLQNFAA